jgi:hypothetical protein
LDASFRWHDGLAAHRQRTFAALSRASVRSGGTPERHDERHGAAQRQGWRALRRRPAICYLMTMKLWVTLLMIVALMVGNASAAAEAVCRHQSPLDHAAARQSDDRRVAAAALTEDAAASVSAKQGAVPSASASILADLLPPAVLAVPLPLAEPLRRQFPDGPVLEGSALPPLLQPPSRA